MAWITLSPDDVPLTPAEKAAVQRAGNVDIAAAIADVVREIRGHLSAGGFVRAPGDTIPDELKGAAFHIIRFHVLSDLPSQILVTQARIDEKKSAEKLLERVADGKFSVEAPPTSSDQVIQGDRPPVTVVNKSSTRREANHDTMRGL